MSVAKQDYSDLEDYYTQGFEREGAVSVWLGLLEEAMDSDLDVLQDLCGVGYYRLDDQESNCFDYELVDIEKLLSELSYSCKFLGEAVAEARRQGINEARWVTVQYDFAYDPSRVSRLIAADPVFIGVFGYSTDD